MFYRGALLSYLNSIISQLKKIHQRVSSLSWCLICTFEIQFYPYKWLETAGWCNMWYDQSISWLIMCFLFPPLLQGLPWSDVIICTMLYQMLKLYEPSDSCSYWGLVGRWKGKCHTWNLYSFQLIWVTASSREEGLNVINLPPSS